MATAAPPESQATAGTSQATRSLSAAQAAEILAIVAATTAAYQRLEDATVGQIQRLWNELLDDNGWFVQRRVDAVVRESISITNEALESEADLTLAYLEEVFDVMGVRVPRSKSDFEVKLPKSIRTGVTPEREWNRPAQQARVARLLGFDEFEANEKAIARAEQQIRMDLILARREAEKQSWGVSGDIISYRRILHPEMSFGGPCGLCIVAASRVYHTSELRPLHNGCYCTVLPIVKDGAGEIFDPGFDMNKDDLDTFYQAAGGTGRQGLQRVRLKHLDHGELGSILVDGKFKNRDKADVIDLGSKRLDPQRVYDAQLKVIKAYEKAVADGKTPQFDIDFHRRTLAEYAKKLGIKSDDRAA